MAWFGALLCLALLQGTFSLPIFEDVTKDNTYEVPDKNYKLPSSVKPSEYRILIKPYVDSSKYDAEVNIDVRISSLVRKIKLHSSGLDITSDNITITPDLGIVNITMDSKYDFLEINTKNMTSLGGNYILTFKYRGNIRDDMTGFYRSYYKHGNETSWIALTHFQPVHARRVFPCFDEPEFKAVFKLTIDCPANYSCISNMDRQNPANESLTIFQPTPKMSTYLLSFQVSKFKRNVMKEHDNFAVWTRPQISDQSLYALEVGVKVLSALENYTGVEYYNLSGIYDMKMDHVAIPDFLIGAMEDWGIISYREPNLLIGHSQSSTKHKLRVASLLTHEMAHQWFGNLITCKWWSETWLNEGFANHLEYIITDQVAPDFHIFKHMIIDELHTSLAADIVAKHPPLTNKDVYSPAEISNHFRLVSYNKAVSVIRMMEHWIGPETFKAGLIGLLQKEYEVVESSDLYNALQKAADADGSIANYKLTVKQVFDSWTVQPGYPVVEVSMDHENSKVYLKQRRYLRRGEVADNLIYHIPISYATMSSPDFGNTKPKLVMTQNTTVLNDTLHEWIILNVQQSGYYRVHYDDSLYKFITDALSENHNVVNEFNRAQLVDDAFSFTQEGIMNFTQLFNIIQFMENETDFTPWSATFTNVNRLRTHFQTFKELLEDFEKHVNNLMVNLITKLGLAIGDEDDDLTRTLRAQTMKVACQMKHEKCIERAITLFSNWVSEPNENQIDPDDREYTYCNALRNGTAQEFDKLWSKFVNEDVANERNVIMVALGCTKDETKINEFLINSLTDSVRKQDKVSSFNAILNGNPENVQVAWDFLKANISEIRASYGSSNIPVILNNIASRMSSDQLTEFETFLNATQDFTPDEVKSGQASAEEADKSLQWVNSVEGEIRAWIKAKYNSAGTLGASLTLILAMLLTVFTKN